MNRKPGDWDCWSCQHLNFSWRDNCHLCGQPKLDGYGGGGWSGSPACVPAAGSNVRPGDWYCSCGTHNFASRSNCLKCGGFKDQRAVIVPGCETDLARSRAFAKSNTWKTGDWMCPRLGCNEHNFASRVECHRCNAPRDCGAHV